MLDMRMTDTLSEVRTLSALTVEIFKACLHGELIRPGDEQYDYARRVWNGMIDKHPALIARCIDTEKLFKKVRYELNDESLGESSQYKSWTRSSKSGVHSLC